MTRTPTSTPASQPSGDAWLFDEPELDEESIALLTAYRAAAEVQRQASRAQAAPQKESLSEAAGSGDSAVPPVPQQQGVRRLDSLDGVRDERLARLHGKLLAAGYLTADILGRTDGLSYRITREGVRRLAGDPVAEAA